MYNTKKIRCFFPKQGGEICPCHNQIDCIQCLFTNSSLISLYHDNQNTILNQNN